MVSGSAIRGGRLGAGSFNEADRGEPAPRKYVSFYCANGHVTRPAFATDAPIPDEWDCPRCGLPASRDAQNPPERPVAAPYKTHLAYVKERRTDNDAHKILDEALQQLRQRRQDGDIFY